MEFIIYFFFFKQKTAYEMRISDWSSDVCSSDLKVLWCRTRPDLFAPALAQAGLPPDRVIYVEAGDDKTVLACVEEGLRHGGLGAVVAEIGRLSMTASRRLQLAAEGTGAIGLALRRWRRQTEARSEENTSEIQSLMRISYAVICLKNKNHNDKKCSYQQ